MYLFGIFPLIHVHDRLFSLPIAENNLEYGQVHQNWETLLYAINLSLIKSKADDWESMLDAMGVARCNMTAQVGTPWKINGWTENSAKFDKENTAIWIKLNLNSLGSKMFI